MKRFVLILMAGMLAAGLAGCGKKEVKVVKPGANPSEVSIWVDQAGITLGQVQAEASRLLQNVAGNVTEQDLPLVQARLLRQAVEGLIDRQLVRAEMKRSDILISQEEIEQAKVSLEQGLGPDQSLGMLLVSAKMTMEELESNIVLDLFRNKVLKERLEAEMALITPERVREFYDARPEQFVAPEGRVASEILVKVTPSYGAEQKAAARERAEALRQRLLDGEDFAALARKESDSATRGRGGQLGQVLRGVMDPALENAVYGQVVGEVGEVVESSMGYHVVLVTGEQEERTIPFEEVADRLRMMMGADVQQRLTRQYVQELREKSTIRYEGMLGDMVSQTSGGTGAAEEEAADAELEPQADDPAEDAADAVEDEAEVAEVAVEDAAEDASAAVEVVVEVEAEDASAAAEVAVEDEAVDAGDEVDDL